MKKNRRLQLCASLAAYLSLNLMVQTGSCPKASAQQNIYNSQSADGQNFGKARQIMERAKQAFKAGDYNAAVSLCQAAMQFNRSDKNITHLLAMSYAESGDNYNANLWFRSTLTLDYNFIEARNNYGLFLHKTGNKSDAKKEYKTIIKINPNYPNAHYNLGTILHEEGDLDGAIEEYRTATRLHPNYFAAQRDLGTATYEKYERGGLKDIQEALGPLLEAAKLIPKNPMVHYHLGHIYCAKGDLDEGEREYRTSLHWEPQFAAGHFELGKIRYLRGDAFRCITEMREALKVNTTYTETKNFPGLDRRELQGYLAKAYEAVMNYPQAAKAWTEVAQLTHDNKAILAHIKALTKLEATKEKKKSKGPVFDEQEFHAMIRKGIELIDEGDMSEAKAVFNRVLEMNPASFEAYQNLGQIQEAEGDLNGATASYQKAIEYAPDFPGLYYNMGFLLEKMQLPTEAGRMYKKYHDLAGRYPYDPKHVVELQLEDVRNVQRGKERERLEF
ncbi:MAG: tetratricopeptide repeat protein [Cyanobacteria bacterium TGS_CYA1]|nr:tetratricopeptide repeat protein [Cyanobacteria bacterium TGS_CYA1]